MTAAEARASSVPAGWLAGALLGLIAASNLLLLAFLGLSPIINVVLVLAGASSMAIVVARYERASLRVPLRTIAICFGIALLALILGGEGRLLFAPADWQIRDAVLADLGRHRWPFAYAMPGGAMVLRAPLGMYLLPSLTGGLGQSALDCALLVQNMIVLGLMLALASTLFATTRMRSTAAIVFALFSGLDLIGTLIARGMSEPASFQHMENWARGLQYTAMSTQLIWAPQHALAGWGCALGFLMWQHGRLRIGTAAATIPLFAFWSPLAAAGAVPFMLYAGLRDLRALRPSDLGIPLLAVAIAAPALVYQHAGAAAVGSGINPVRPLLYLLGLLLEVAPFAIPALIYRHRFSGPAIWIAVAMLVLAPLWRVGTWADFQMRVTIVPLCILAAATADLLLQGDRPKLRRWLIAMLAIGTATTLSELFPLPLMRVSPPPLCSLPSAWDQQTGLVTPKSTYLAPIAALPIRPREIVDPRRDPAQCWSRRWVTLRFQ